MQPYKPLGGSLERHAPGNALRRQEGSQLEPSNRGYAIEGHDHSSMHFSGQSSIRLPPGDDDAEQNRRYVVQSAARGQGPKANNQKIPLLNDRGNESFVKDHQLDRKRKPNSQLESSEEPNYANLRGGFNSALHHGSG